jgi:hypothetical protein
MENEENVVETTTEGTDQGQAEVVADAGSTQQEIPVEAAAE